MLLASTVFASGTAVCVHRQLRVIKAEHMAKNRVWGLIVVFAIQGLGACAHLHPPADDRSAELAVLVVNRASLRFEGGARFVFDDCGPCDDMGLPLSVVYESPADFGSIAFVHSVYGDTVFAGTIIWDGVGQLTHPTLDPPRTFRRCTLPPDLPAELELFEFNGNRTESPWWYDDVVFAWTRIARLEMAQDLLGPGSRVGVYRYNPVDGGPEQPEESRWVFFIYRVRGHGESPR